MSTLAEQYKALFSGVNSILNDVNTNWSANLANNFSGKIVAVQKSCAGVVDMLGHGANIARTSAESFQSIDSQLAKVFVGDSKSISKSIDIKKQVDTSSSGTTVESSWWDKLKKSVSSGVNGIQTGAAKVVHLGETVVSSVIESYQNKGGTWKALKSVSAIAVSIGAVASAAAAWGMTAGSGGLGVPVASLVTIHSANTVANSFSDMYNCWFGDVNEVGQVNYLKSIDEAVLGKSMGGVAYNLGSIVSTIASVRALQGRLKQAPDMLSAIKGAGRDLKAEVGGVFGIASDVLSGQTSLSHVGVQINLLSKNLTHLTDLTKCVGILADVGEKTETIVNTAVKSVYEAINPEETYNSSITDMIFEKNDTISTIKEAYDDVKNIGTVSDDYQKLRDAYVADKIQYGNS